MTPAQRWMGRISRIGCIACIRLGYEDTAGAPVAVHHIREGRISRNDFLTIPLCPEHHTGSHQSVHLAKPALMRALGVESEFDLLAIVIARVET